MTDRVDDDFVFRDLVEDEERIRRRGEAANEGIIGADPNFRVSREQFDQVLNALLNAHCTNA